MCFWCIFRLRFACVPITYPHTNTHFRPPTNFCWVRRKEVPLCSDVCSSKIFKVYTANRNRLTIQIRAVSSWLWVCFLLCLSPLLDDRRLASFFFCFFAETRSVSIWTWIACTTSERASKRSLSNTRIGERHYTNISSATNNKHTSTHRIFLSSVSRFEATLLHFSINSVSLDNEISFFCNTSLVYQLFHFFTSLSRAPQSTREKQSNEKKELNQKSQTITSISICLGAQFLTIISVRIYWIQWFLVL